MKARLLTLAAAAAATWLLYSQASGTSNDIGVRRIDYRPGGYFPEGFPLHGKVRLLSPSIVEMGTRNRHRVEVIIGDLPVEAGMSVEVWKHFTSDVEEFQVSNPNAPAYFGSELSPPSTTRFYPNNEQRNNPSVFPYRKCAAVQLTSGRLAEGDKIVFDLGGPQGVRMQHYEENLFNFRFVISKNEQLVGYIGDAALKVTGGPLARLRVQAPSVVKAGDPFPVEVVPMDAWASRAKNATSLKIRFRNADGALVYDSSLEHYIARDVRHGAEGVLRLEVETGDGTMRGVSNPIWVEKDPQRGVYYGELHQHTYLADGRGRFDELYLYGRRVGLLDFGAVTPHHTFLTGPGPSFYLPKRYPVDAWPELQKVTREANGWNDFVSILGYEYSVGTQAGGHHNVFYNADRAASTMDLNPAQPSAPIGNMLRTLQLSRVPTLVIPHIGGGPPDWSHPTDQRIERLFEIASVHGVFEESYQKHLEAGQRQGVIAAGDTHTTSMGIAYPGLIYVNSNGLAGVQSFGRNRRDIWDGLYQRRTFATTGNQRINVEFSVNGERMGGEIGSQMHKTARATARVSGTAGLLKLELIKNNKVLHSVFPARRNARLVRIVWGDNYYQRRACTALRSGHLQPSGGRLSLVQAVNIDQAFESIRQDANGVAFTTASVSGDRDGVLLNVDEITGGAIRFRYDDPEMMGVVEVEIPLEKLRQEGHFRYQQRARQGVSHPYMKAMGIEPAFTVEADFVDPNAPMDATFEFEDRTAPKPGDFYYLRLEQMDTNKAWASPVWVN